MKIIVTAHELLQNCNDWDKVCDALGPSPYCLKEGRMDGEDEISLTEEQAREFGILGD